jgi:hypothetical protein
MYLLDLFGMMVIRLVSPSGEGKMADDRDSNGVERGHFPTK